MFCFLIISLQQTGIFVVCHFAWCPSQPLPASHYYQALSKIHNCFLRNILVVFFYSKIVLFCIIMAVLGQFCLRPLHTWVWTRVLDQKTPRMIEIAQLCNLLGCPHHMAPTPCLNITASFIYIHDSSSQNPLLLILLYVWFNTINSL